MVLSSAYYISTFTVIFTRSDRLVHSENAGSGLDPGVDAARKTLGLIDWTQLSGPELHSRLDELVRIKHSVQVWNKRFFNL